MGIKKQEFYEGAALHLLIRSGGVTSIRYHDPFFLINRQLLIYLKYCTRSRSPWSFTLTREEQLVLKTKISHYGVVIGLICGADGVVALRHPALRDIAGPTVSTIHIACYRQHGEHYEVSGPAGSLLGKIAPSNWLRILTCGENDETSRPSPSSRPLLT